MRSWTRALPVFGALVVLLAATSCDRLSRFVPCVEHRHASGIAVVCPEDIGPYKAASVEVMDSVRVAYDLAWANPDVFGYPKLDFEKAEVVVRVVRVEAESIARTRLPRSGVAVRFEAATRSVAQLTKIQNDVGPNLADVPDATAIYQSGPDSPRNATRFVIDHESNALLQALAARYGREALVVEVKERPNVGY